MPRVRRDRGSQLKGVAIDRIAINKPWLAECEGACLVKDDGIHFSEAFKCAAILDHDALFEQAPRGNDLHHGNGEAESAGTCDDQDRDCDSERPVDVPGRSHPADKCRHGSHVNHGSVKPGRAVGYAPVRRAS